VSIRVVLAEDHPMFREGLRALLDAQPTLTVLAAFPGGRAAAAAVEEHDVDVVVLDLSMPDGDGLEATRLIREGSPRTRILVLTSYDSEREITAALQAGAHGYVLKSASPEEIIDAVLAVASGSSVLSDTVLATVARRAAGPAGVRGARPFPELTDRELEVLECVAEGMDNPQIARQLGLSLKTVRNYVSNVLVKLSARDRAAAVVQAKRHGIGQ
jgi:DNA-binding NarL/FixJ family response regulator